LEYKPKYELVIESRDDMDPVKVDTLLRLERCLGQLLKLSI